jgi:hypothetical protein
MSAVFGFLAATMLSPSPWVAWFSLSRLAAFLKTPKPNAG